MRKKKWLGEVHFPSNQFPVLKLNYGFFSETLFKGYSFLERLFSREFIFEPGETQKVSDYKQYVNLSIFRNKLQWNLNKNTPFQSFKKMHLKYGHMQSICPFVQASMC